MESVEFKQSSADPCVYVHTSNTTIIRVYVDDLIVITKTAQKMQRKIFGFLIQDEGHVKSSLLPWNQYRTIRSVCGYIRKILEKDPNWKPLFYN